MLKEETLAVTKDLLLPFWGFKEGGNKILVFAIIDLQLEEGLIGKFLNLKFAKGFNGAIRDGV